MKTYVMLIALVGLLAGCMTPEKPPPTATVYDSVTGERRDVSDNLLPSPVDPPREIIYLTSFREYPRYGAQSKYFFSVKYIASAEVGLLEIPPGQTLTLLADGQPIKLDGTGSVNMRKQYKQDDIGFVTETAFYPVSKADLQKLGYARKIRVQVKGNKGLVERDFSQENYKNLRSFVTFTAL
jgi:hypothetical protein